METQALIEQLMSVFVVFILGFVAWCTRALSAGQIGRHSWIGIRTRSVTHCDKCWLLGHHAAAAKINISLGLAAVITVIPAVLSIFLQIPSAVIAVSWIAGLAAVVVGVMLGARDAAWVTSKIHVKDGDALS